MANGTTRTMLAQGTYSKLGAKRPAVKVVKKTK